ARRDRPPRPVAERAAPPETARGRSRGPELDERLRAFFLRHQQVAAAQEHGAFAARALRVGPRARDLAVARHLERDRGHDPLRSEIDELDSWRSLLQQQDAAAAVSADGLDL